MKICPKLFTSVITATFIHVAQAVTVATPTGGLLSNHEIAPASGAPWDNVVDVNGNSGVYIGGGWILTARHVFESGTATVTYDGATYSSDNSFILDLQDTFLIEGVPTTGDTDLRLFRLENSIAALPTLAIGSVSANNDVTMIGRGGTPRTKRWGTNNVEQLNQGAIVEGRPTMTFTTDYDTGTTGEGHAIGGDSGGGVFYNNGSEWQIAGIMSAVNNTPDPDIAFHVQLSRYETDINNFIALNGSAPVPEPGTTALISLSFMGFLLRRSRT